MTCPRCGAAMEQVLYSPCEKCRRELREWAAIRSGTRNLIIWLAGNPQVKT